MLTQRRRKRKGTRIPDPIPTTYLAAADTPVTSDDVPAVLGRMAELAARNAGRQAEVADRNLLIHHLIGEVIGAPSHGANKHAAALLGVQRVDVVTHADERRIETERDLAAVGREMIRDRVGNDPEELFLRRRRADGEPVQQLHHQASESLECPGYPHRGRHLDQDALGRVDVDLQPAGLVDRGVDKGQQALRVSCVSTVLYP